jgi:hypothetical protein
MSVRQIEVSRTLVFAAFRHAHGFFEALVTDYLEIACPEQGKLIFRHPGGALAHPRCSSHFKTKVITRGVDATVNAFTLPSLGDLDDLGQERHRQPVRLCGEEDPLQRPAGARLRGTSAQVGGEDGDHRLLLEVLTRCPDGGGACAEVPQHPGIVRNAVVTLVARPFQAGSAWKAVSIGWVRCARVARVRSCARLVALVHNVQPRGLVERRMPQGGIVLRQRNGDITEGMPARVRQRHRTQHPLDLGSDRLVATAAHDGDQLRLLGRSGSSVTIGGCPL